MLNIKYVNSTHCLVVFSLLLLLMIGCKPDVADSITYRVPNSSGKGAIQPEMALSSFELAPGFNIELIASEPLISDPVDMIIDEYGQMYVTEMHGYPLDTSGTGKIKLLKDSDGDGRMDKATVFADDLTMPFGLMRWKKGLIVADAPQILYFEDTTGDGIADVRQVMLSGFAFSNAQMNAGNPIYGLDNWIYLTSEAPGTYQLYNDLFGYMGDDIYFPAHSKSPRIPQRPSRTVRFRPDKYELELTAGTTQFGHDFDIWGRHFLGNNSIHIYHEVISGQYLKRNKDLLISDVTQNLTDHGSNVYPITIDPERQLLTSEGIFTSACGNTAYTGNAFPSPYNNAFFVAEPVSNLVHVDLLNDNGASFTASSPRPKKEFLTSSDAWFRPVNMYSGPDGALYILDYYRQIIEHPEWMSKEAIEAGELYNGVNMGRIYRITSTKSKPASWTEGLRLGNYTNEELLKELTNPNGWWRLNSQRLIVDRGGSGAIPELVKMVTKSVSPFGRLHALWTLEGLGELQPKLISKALRDTVPEIRENAIKLAELYLVKNPTLVQDLLEMKNDSNDKVRFQLLLTLGFVDTPSAAHVRNDLLFENLNDNWFQIAALSASSSQTESLLKMVINNFDGEVPAYTSLVERVSSMLAASGTSASIRQLIVKATKNEQWPPAVPILEGLAQGLKGDSQVSKEEQNILVNAFFKHPSISVREASLKLLKVTGIQDEKTSKASIKKVLSLIVNRNLPNDNRIMAINFMSLYDPAPYTDLIKNLIVPQEEASIQLAALEVLSKVPDLTVSNYVLQQWPTFTPEIREASLSTFMSDKKRVALLLDALETDKINISNVNFSLSTRLMTGYGENLSRRARALFANEEKGDVSKSYQKALEIEGNSTAGKSIYLKYCAICHKKGDNGTAFGPDLGTIKSWETEAIMAHILDPGISIAAGYDLWTATLSNGDILGGIISSETPSTITLRNVGGVERTIGREDIKSLKTLGMSAMPTGFDKQINPNDMNDLLTYLKQTE